ncbi:MAG: hypothetical protein KDD32_12415 [Bacteroidetes bacterium]|nr:hypothetical protein [Bacteroidota bacterium]
MKTVAFILMFLPLFSHAINLMDAYQDEAIEISITGSDSEDFSQTGIKVDITNHKNEDISITADPGFIFHSDDETIQDLILTEPLLVNVKAKNNATAEARAMCIQAANGSPGIEHTFVPSAIYNDKLVKACQYIYQYNYQNHMGQDALWAISDNKSIYNISGEADVANPLRSYIADLVGVAFDTSLINKNEHYVDQTIKAYALYLKFFLQETDDIKLQLFDHRGDFERDLIVKKNQPKGRYDMQYKVSLLGLLGQKYFVRLYVGDEMRTEFTLVIKES